MGININRVLLFAFASALLLALSTQVDSTPTVSLAPDVALGAKLSQGHGGAGEGACHPGFNPRMPQAVPGGLRYLCGGRHEEQIDDVKSGDYYKA